MMSTNFFLTNEFAFIFNHAFVISNDYLFSTHPNVVIHASNALQHDFFYYSTHQTLYTKSIISYINQFEDLNLFNNTDNISAIYHYSIPNTKLAYPEPFIAAPSFMHSDL